MWQQKQNFAFNQTLTGGVVVVAAVPVGDVGAAAAVVQPHPEDGLQDGADAGLGHLRGTEN